MRRVTLPVCFLLFVLACHSDRVQWQWTLKGQCYATPLVDGNTIFAVTQAGEVVAGDLRTGIKLWRILLPDPLVSGASGNERRIFIAGQAGGIYSLDKADGKVVWKSTIPGESFEAPLAVAADLLLAPSAHGTLYALGQEDGRVRWSHTDNSRYTTQAVVAEHRILIGGWSNNLLCLGLDGHEQWRFRPGSGGAIVRDAVIDKNRVFFTSRDNHVYSLDLPTGRLLWRFPANYPSNLILIDHRLLFADLEGNLIFLNPESGEVARKLKTSKNIHPIYAWQNICLAVADRIYRVDPAGQSFTEFANPSARPIFHLALTPGRVIAAAGNSIMAIR